MEFFGMNRFHFLAALTWQFTIFLATQMIFPIFSVYVSRWRCRNSSLNSFGKNCTLFKECHENIEFENDYFYSSALEFGWICGPSAYLATFYSQAQFFGVLIGKTCFYLFL